MRNFLSLKQRTVFGWWAIWGIRFTLIILFHIYFICNIVGIGSASPSNEPQLAGWKGALWFFGFCILELILIGITFGHIGILINKIKRKDEED